jgi:hypothetical protein
MLSKIVIVLVLAIAALAIAQKEGAFQEWGVTGSCEAVRPPAGDSGSWYACSEGFLTGYPSLIGDHCTYQVRAGGHQYWRCDAPLNRKVGY